MKAAAKAPQNSAIAGVCRHCGCTDSTPCLIFDEEAGDNVPCAWIDEDENVCSNPECVEKEYRQVASKYRGGR